MEQDARTHRWVARGWIFIAGLLLFMVAALWGGRVARIPFLEFPVGGLIRYALHFPIQTRVAALPKSPGGTWEVKIRNRYWTYHDQGDMSTIELIADKHGRPFLGGRRLDPCLDMARLYGHWKADWLSDSLLRFDNTAFLRTGSPRQTTATLTIINATSATIPYVMVHSYHQAFFRFELAAHAHERFDFYVPTTAHSAIGGMAGPAGKYVLKEYPFLTGGADVGAITLTIRKGEKTEITFTPAPALKAAAL